MDFLQSLLDNSSVPVITAFILGILTAISPCPLATNITAIGFIGKDIENRHRIFINGLLYTFGRIVTYTVLGGILIPVLREGASMYMVQKAVSKYGEMLIAPVLILVGIFMLDIIKLNIPKINIGGEGLKKKTKGSWGVLLLGILFALAFCPTSGVFYFGILMPLAAVETGGYFLPVIYAIATGLPVILVAWILAYSVAGLGRFYNSVQIFEKWFRKIVAILFIVIGIYYAVVFLSMNNLIKIKDSMKKIEIFDPAMCCPTGLCGTNINPELMRVAVVVETLKRQGVIVTRHNLRDEPQVYVSNKTVNEYLQKNGAEALPITLVDGEIAVSKVYPTTKQMSEWTGVNLDLMPAK